MHVHADSTETSLLLPCDRSLASNTALDLRFCLLSGTNRSVFGALGLILDCLGRAALLARTEQHDPRDLGQAYAAKEEIDRCQPSLPTLATAFRISERN